MSAQRLSAKSVRRIERDTGLVITRGWAHGGYTFDFVVHDVEHPDRHRHGWWNKKSGEWGIEADGGRYGHGVLHYTTCAELFPELCCDRHNRACEPPSELCCQACTEATHPHHDDGSLCVLAFEAAR